MKKDKEQEVEKVVDLRRVYKKDVKIESDLFKLEVEMMKKNPANGFNSDGVEHINVEHCHFFRTFDSDGRPQKYCSPTGGHFHLIETTTPSDGDARIKIVSVGKPMQHVNKIVHGIPRKMVEPVHGDQHVHKHTYIRTDTVDGRKYCAQAAQLIGAEEAKLAAIPGIN